MRERPRPFVCLMNSVNAMQQTKALQLKNAITHDTKRAL